MVTYELNRWKVVTARKHHRCQHCRVDIEPGQTYKRGSGLYDDYWWTSVECIPCTVIYPLALNLCWGGYHEDDCEPLISVLDYWHLLQCVVAAEGVRTQWGRLAPTPDDWDES